jgi:AcrR family transcriptional regulator
MSSMQGAAKRKAPAERQGEIIEAASRVARMEGLDSLTLRRVADELGVVPGLVNHYFPAADDLVAAAFGYAAAAERDTILAALDPGAPALRHVRHILHVLLSPATDDISLLWLDAWQATRRRPALRAEVTRQMQHWRAALTALIRRGVCEGALRTADADRAAFRILALIDGMSIQAAMRGGIDYAPVREMVIAVAERELGLGDGGLAAHSKKEGVLF